MGSACRSGGSVYRTRPCGQRILVDTVARRAGVALDPPRLDRRLCSSAGFARAPDPGGSLPLGSASPGFGRGAKPPPRVLASSRGVRAKERPRRAGRLRLRVVSRHALPCLPRPIRIAQVQVAQADLHEGLGRLSVTELEDLLKLDQRLPVVVLHVVRLTDPVLGGPGERVLLIAGKEVEEIEDRLTVLTCPEGRHRRGVRLLGACRPRLLRLAQGPRGRWRRRQRRGRRGRRRGRRHRRRDRRRRWRLSAWRCGRWLRRWRRRHPRRRGGPGRRLSRGWGAARGPPPPRRAPPPPPPTPTRARAHERA